MKKLNKRLKREMEKRIQIALKDGPVRRDDQDQKEAVQNAVEVAIATVLVDHVWANHVKYGNPAKRANGIASKM